MRTLTTTLSVGIQVRISDFKRLSGFRKSSSHVITSPNDAGELGRHVLGPRFVRDKDGNGRVESRAPVL